jgi:hypothetical protein
MRLRGRGGSPSRPSTRANHAAFFSLFIGSLRKNGRLGDQALPSLNPDSEVKNRARAYSSPEVVHQAGGESNTCKCFRA